MDQEQDPSTDHVYVVKLSKAELEDLDKLQAVKANERKNGRRLQRNLLVLAISFVFLFTAFLAMANLQSSLNKKGGLGSYSLAILYLVYAIASLFVPSLLIPRIGSKWTLIVSMIGYVVYIAAQFHPTFFTLIPAAVLLGLCASPLWAAQSMYVTKLGEEYAFLTGQTKDDVLPRFFGLFFLTFQTCHIWGNLIAAKLLAKDDATDFHVLSKDTRPCGRDYCPSLTTSVGNVTMTRIVEPTDYGNTADMSKVYILSTIFLATSVTAAVILIFFLDGLDKFAASSTSKDETPTQGPSVYSRAIATVKNLKDPLQLLIIPMTAWTGYGQGFIGADLTAAYITCAWGVSQIGYVFICYGICNSSASFIFGKLTKCVGRPIIFTLSHCFYFVAVIIMWTWEPSGDAPVMFFVVAALWGLGDGIMNTQTNALNGLIFPHALEAAFSNNRFWNSAGYLTAYVMANKVCMSIKLWFMVASIGVSLVCYLLVEVGVTRKAKRVQNLETQETTKSKPPSAPSS